MHHQVTVWTKPNCIQCVMVKKLLTREEVDFVEKDITAPEHETELNTFMAVGIKSAPITQYGDFLIAGFADETLKNMITIWKGDNVDH